MTDKKPIVSITPDTAEAFVRFHKEQGNLGINDTAQNMICHIDYKNLDGEWKSISRHALFKLFGDDFVNACDDAYDRICEAEGEEQ